MEHAGLAGPDLAEVIGAGGEAGGERLQVLGPLGVGESRPRALVECGAGREGRIRRRRHPSAPDEDPVRVPDRDMNLASLPTWNRFLELTHLSGRHRMGKRRAIGATCSYGEVMTAPILHLSLPVDDLVAARRFYEDALGCRIGRVREEWFDVWFFGLQLTLALRPEEVRGAEEQGSRHFGVVLDDLDEFSTLVERLRAQGAPWLTEPAHHDAAELSGKMSGKLADPAGNVIEIKYYGDRTEYLGQRVGRSA